MVEWWLNGDFMGFWMGYYPLVVTHIANWKIWTIEIGDLRISNGDFPVRYVSHYQRVDLFGTYMIIFVLI